MSNPPKVMSSRLMTMKFMQRNAAEPTSPSSPDQPAAKRQRQSDNSEAFAINSLVDKNAVQAAIAEEERIREAAIERAAEQAGDMRWYLSFQDQDHSGSGSSQKSLQVIHTGYASIDSPVSQAGDNASSILTGRRSFGKFNRAIEVCNNSSIIANPNISNNLAEATQSRGRGLIFVRI